MGAGTAPGLSQEGGSSAPARIARAAGSLARAATEGLRRPASPYVRALAVVVVAVAFISALTYYGAREFAGRAAESRGAAEAHSLAAHSGRLATGDAYNAYLQILRYADDPTVRSPEASAPERTAALERLLFLNTNIFDALVVAELRGTIRATSDPAIGGVRRSEAFLETRESHGPSNSDMVLVPGEAGYVEFAAPLVDESGRVWGVLLGRSSPGRLWNGTLRASVDSSRNVILNSAGQFAAGVPAEALGEPWSGQPLPNGTVRADIAGTDSICGLRAIGEDTIIDRGWNVAACLPTALVQAEHAQATGKQARITIAGAILAVIVAAGALRFAMQERPPLLMLPWPSADTTTEAAGAGEAAAVDRPANAAPPGAAVRRDVDAGALALIEAYESRNARVAEQLREAVRAKLLTGTSQVDESYRLARTDPELAKDLHARAMEQLGEARERDLRRISQEIHPALVRLGLPAALRGLAKDLADIIDLGLDLDFGADAVEGTGDRSSLDDGLRRAAYRVALDGARALASAGATDARLTLRREGDELTLLLEAGTMAEPDTDELSASRLAVEAYGGTVTLAGGEARTLVRAAIPL